MITTDAPAVSGVPAAASAAAVFDHCVYNDFKH